MRAACFLILVLTYTSCDMSSHSNPYLKSWSEADQEYLLTHLDVSLQGIIDEVKPLTEAQWNWRTDTSEWSIAQVVEHLIVHDELFSREVRVLTALPEMIAQNDSLFSDDASILSYSEITLQNTGNSPSYMEPLGRWCSKEDAVMAYSRIRRSLIDFVKTCDKDLRKYYTASGRGPTRYRDIHQLLLISIAHTQRHLSQIQNIKLSKNPDFGN